MEKDRIIKELSEKVSRLIGCKIGTDHIHTDEAGWYYYIPAKSLYQNRPLILNHYRGPLFMVIPVKDWEKLEQEEISVQEYIDNSVWNYGYFWGGGSLLGGIHWQPLEEGTGIHDTEKICRYLTILRCRTNRVSSGYLPQEEACAKCTVKNCPFSKFSSKEASWDNEVQEVDDRELLYEIISQRIENQFGLKAVCFMSTTKESAVTILLETGFELRTVKVYVSQSLLIDLMYYPGKYDIVQMGNNFNIKLGIAQYCLSDGEYVPPEKVDVPEDADIQFCYDFWKKDPYCGWFPKEVSAVISTAEMDKRRDSNMSEKIVKFFKNLF